MMPIIVGGQGRTAIRFMSDLLWTTMDAFDTLSQAVSSPQFLLQKLASFISQFGAMHFP